MSAVEIKITPDGLTLDVLRRVLEGPVRLSLAPECWAAVEASAATVAALAAGPDDAYGINTGFGKLAQTRISIDDLGRLQGNLIASHCAGVGPPFGDNIVRLVMVLKVKGLSRGFSGVRPVILESLSRLLEGEVYPVVPSKGSVGASGDLAPLAHLAGILLGLGEARVGGERMPAAQALARVGLAPITLAPKEGLALINGTQVSTALALSALFKTENLFAAAVVAGAMSVDAAKGSDTPFDARLQEVRGHRGQKDVARVYRALLADSPIRASHVACASVQDPYSLRCQPQVMGACLDHMRFVAGTLEVEASAVSDNPLVFADTGEVLSGGNFHAEPVALAADTLALAIAEVGALSERRVALLVDTTMSGLPPFLVEDSGINSGFMIAQVTAAALASENKSLAHPASVDSLPTSANQEDHVSMATFAARRLGEMAENSAGIIAIELLAAAQGIDFHRPLTTSPRLAEVFGLVRAKVPRYESDRMFTPDIEAVRWLIEDGAFLGFADSLLPSAA